MPPTAFITGITGQDGSYLAEYLLARGYVVHGLVRRPDALQASPIAPLVNNPAVMGKALFLHHGALEDAAALRRAVGAARPSEFYHLAGQSSPRMALESPEAAVASIGMGTLRVLEILRELTEPPRFLHASSSEVFGSPPCSPQDELTPLNPTTPYGVAKAFAQQMTKVYRTVHGLKACSAILFNHESPRRSDRFLPMKVARGVARIKKGLQADLTLGRLDGRRDWGWAPDYARGMALILQSGAADEFVLATGRLHSVEELVRAAFAAVDLDWRPHVAFDGRLVAAVEPAALCGNPAKAGRLLGWENTVPFEEMVVRLVRAELDRA
jgi:GDPmannose 4,6-dehydratase